jgi:predicted DNA binding CopG/RHH family protein
LKFKPRHRLTVRVSEYHYLMLKKRARMAGLSVSDFLAELLVKAKI